MVSFSLLQSLNESINDKGKFKAIFVIGTPGAGKSYVINNISDGSLEPRIINSDKMHEFLTGGNASAATWAEHADRIKTTTGTQLAHYINGMLPLFIDSTSSSTANVIRRKGILESFGYDTGLIWIDTNIETAVARAAERQRHVPEEFIRDVAVKAEAAKAFLQQKFEWSQTISNNDGELTDAVIRSAYNNAGSFFNSPVSNHIGQEALRELASKGEKYLAPSIVSIEEIQHAVTAWYKKG